MARRQAAGDRRRHAGGAPEEHDARSRGDGDRPLSCQLRAPAQLCGALLWAAAALLAALAAPAGAAAAPGPGLCVEDGDCTGTLLCVGGRCRRSDCRHDADCPSGRLCRAGACRLRECYADTDCNIERRCVEGICALPGPELRQRAAQRPSTASAPGAPRLDIGFGPTFPLGILAEVGLRTGAQRWSLGAATAHDVGGLGLRASAEVDGGRLGPLAVGSFAALLWSQDDATNVALGPAAGALLGAGRWLFRPDRRVRAGWMAAGLLVTLPHGRDNRRQLRLELGAMMLLHGRYQPAYDVALLPTAALRYGVGF